MCKHLLAILLALALTLGSFGLRVSAEESSAETIAKKTSLGLTAAVSSTATSAASN